MADMKLALYLPSFRDHVTVQELEDQEFPTQLPASSRGSWFQGWPLIPGKLAHRRTKPLEDLRQLHEEIMPTVNAHSRLSR